MFAPIPGTATYGNVVIGNRAIGNGLPGVALHSHAPNQNLNDDDADTPGTTGIVVFGVSPVTGTIISQNVVEREDIAVAVKTDADVDVHLNDVNNHKVGVANLNAGSVDAVENWWGCAHGPGAPGCSSVSGPDVTTMPSLHQPIHP